MLNRILIVFLALALIAMGVLGLVAASVVRDSVESLSLERLTNAEELVATELADGVSVQDAARKGAEAFSSDVHTVRVTLVAKDGTVLADTAADPAGLDNHLFRPEIAQALASGGSSSDTRYSATLGMDMLYYARYDAAHGLVVRTSLPLVELQSAKARLTNRVALVAAVLFLLFLGIGLVSVRVVSRPLVEMKTAAEAITGGRYDLRVHRVLGDRSHIGRLARSFNGMADRLEASIADLEDKSLRMDAILESMDTPLFAVDRDLGVTFRNSEALRRFGGEVDLQAHGTPLILHVRSREVESFVRGSVREGRRADLEWKQETDDGMRTWRVSVSPLRDRDGGAIVLFHDLTEILRLQRIRTDFAANVTHELSTPLTAIRGFVETLRGGASKDPDLTARFLEIIDVESERLQRLIEDILTVSEIEGGRAALHPASFDLNERIDRSVVLLEETAAKRGVHLVAGPPRAEGETPAGTAEAVETDEPARLDVVADPDRVGQLLVNLLDNAVKYNRKEGTVWVWAERGRDGRVKLHVKDTGIGIAEEQKSRIFERFYRVDAGRSRETGGTGLGLSIVKHIALLYKGNVRIESEPGVGSEFIVTLEI